MRLPASPPFALTVSGTFHEVPGQSAAVQLPAAQPPSLHAQLIDLARALGRQAAAELWVAQFAPITPKET